MRVFLSWSGPRSKTLALHLHEWLRAVVQRTEPWMSERDLEAGQRWNEEISGKLRDTHFGVICLTRENLAAPWLLFEAGALAKSIETARVVPVLLGVRKSDLTFPLAQFQAVDADEQGLRSLAAAVNGALGADRLQAPTLDNLFKALWPGVSAAIASIPTQPTGGRVHRTDRELLEELVEGLHQIRRSVTPQSSDSEVRHSGRDDWEGFYLQGVTLANKRGGRAVDVAAARAYSNAIALAPAELPGNIRSRLYSYRGAMFKRLMRLEEAQQDLTLARRWASEPREVDDATYNLACVLAMGSSPRDALPLIECLVHHDPTWVSIVNSKREYFGKLIEDPEFKHLMTVPRPL
ncbi:MAG: toll/interleukin-1 receptor domain-containing protein [Planctomycetes bacterium]|nr:toll/interleukin-1 receptor domain-containing protein [Planctomycetota bacterium]